MLRLTRYVVLMAVALLMTTNITAQENDAFERQHGDIILGLNGGLSYQQSDVTSRMNGFGLGLTYGKNLFYKPYAPFSIDARGRLQFSRSYGMDIRPSLGIANNDALNGEKNLDYTGEEEGGLVYANHKTSQAEAGLEGVITLNGLRENTGLGIAFSGGVGLNWYKAKIDQRDANGLYSDQYDLIDAGGAKPYNISQLKGFRDGKYETLADDFGKVGKFGIMPSLGVEVDYDLTNNLAVGMGHRITFSGTDLLDGQQWTNANTLTGNNDILHYTSLGLKYTFNKNKANNKRKPVIELIEPYGSGVKTRSAIFPIKAIVNRVENPFDVYMTVNGKEQKFNFNDQTLAGRVRLRAGENKIVITANNRAGSVQKSFFIIYEKEENLGANVIDFGKPEIDFINPATNNLKIEEDRFNLRAKVRLAKKGAIELRINGKKRGFDFDNGISILESTIQLREGKNTIEIIAKNRNGEQRLQRTIFRELPIPFPTVQFISPAYNNAKVENSIVPIKINVSHVEQSSNIQLFVNRKREPNFYFQRGEIKADIQLLEGQNEVEIIVRNQRGEAKDQRTIIYERPFRPTIRRPRITINAPSYSQTSTREEVVPIHATLENIFRKSEIRFTNNGLAIYDFDFNPNSGILRHNLFLREGINRVVIEARNEAGQDGASATINLEIPIVLPPPPPPVIIAAPDVDIFYPQRNDVFEKDEIEVKAIIRGVSSKRDIEFIVNRNDCVIFNFNPSNGKFRANIPLKEGENVIAIKAKNAVSIDRHKIIVFHEKPYRPTIKFKTANNTISENKLFKFKANVDYVKNKRNIEIRLNDRIIRDFKFRNNKVEAEVRLKEGENIIKIIASNKYGTERKRLNVDYFRPLPPVVNFSNIRDNQTFRENRHKLVAKVENVENIRNLKLFVNGVLAKGVDLEGDIFTAHIQLKEGRNSIALKANTEHGTDEQQLRVNYIRPKVRSADISSRKARTRSGILKKGSSK